MKQILLCIKKFVKRHIKTYVEVLKVMHNPQSTVLCEMPHVSLSVDAASLYKYYWFAENVQYYNADLFFVIGFKNCRVLPLPKYAAIPLNYSFDEYMKECIKSPERALIRKSIKNGFTVREIQYDAYLDEIKQINTSKLERMGHEMADDYVHPRVRDKVVKPYNPDIHTYGCFSSEGKLVAYYMFEKFTNFYHVVKGIGHSDYLSYGIMNHLFAYSISELSSKKECEMVIYGSINPNKRGNGLSRFKHNVGCQVKSLVYKGTKEDFINLREFNKRFILHDDSALNFVNEYIIKS